MTGVDRIRTQIVLSVIAGLMVLAIVMLTDRAEDVKVTYTDRAMLSVALGAAYIIGISMALRPNWRSRYRRGPLSGTGASVDGKPLPGPPRRGHHPDCDAFMDHTITWSGRTRCAGCTGLTVGASAAILLTAMYAFDPVLVLWTSGPGLVMAGVALVALDLFASVTGGLDPRAGMGLNALMMVGFTMVSVGLLETTGELTWGLVGVVNSALWMDSRIQVSRWNHAALCAACQKECVAYTL
jgi:hypothetical protein